MAKQLNQVDVSLNFSADTKKAKQEIDNLMQTLRQFSTFSGASSSIINAKEMQEASRAARELEQHLRAATDMNTGKLNLSAFSASLKASGKDLNSYRKTFESIGPAGEAAFLKVSKSIALADAPLRKTNERLKEFAVTLKNTARWQISSSIMHGFMGTLQSAYGYAQDLNESLNNIRIVTGQSVEQMGQFADRANRAAQSLSTTTRAYTDAALIFYQQGLDDKAVEERTNATIKMSNVTGDAATEVSSYMTAIWNNFDDGSESLEHYADVITALGAATASSSSEIAGGLEKFAAIGKQIGLSYEYATAALATVVAQTRQSEDVVGTAFKTIFARIQGLNLGETMDDGTNLNKYSKALETVGVSIKDANGEVKDMNAILDELGSKWNTLSKDVQIATAQTVAGVRQYNQLIALMDNWDTFKQNVSIADNSDGTLENQAEIYAESWEAAQKRVKAALENIYSTLLDDKFFIKLTNAFAVLLQGVEGFAEGMGGMKGILFTASSFITQKLAKEAPAALESMKQNLMQMTGHAKSFAETMQSANLEDLRDKSATVTQNFETEGSGLAVMAEIRMTELLAEQKLKLNQYGSQYSEAEKQRAQSEIEHLQSIQNLLVAQGERYDTLNSKSSELEASIQKLGKNFSSTFDGKKIRIDDVVANLRDLTKQSAALKIAQQNFTKFDKVIKYTGKDAQKLAKDYSNLAKNVAKSLPKGQAEAWTQLSNKMEQAGNQADITGQDIIDLVKDSEAFKNMDANADQASQGINQLEAALKQCKDIPNAAITQFVSVLKEMGMLSMEVPVSLDNAGTSMNQLGAHASTGSEALMDFSGALMQANALISSVKSFADVFTDEDAGAIEKVGAVIGVLTTGLMTFNSISKLTSSLMALETAQHKQAAIAGFLHAAAGNAEAQAELAKTHPKLANIAATIAQTLANWGLNASMAPLLVVTLALTAAVVALAAGVAIAVAIFKAWKNSTPEAKLAALKEEANGLQEQLNASKEAAKDLQDSFDGYTSVVEKLESCTRGTEEWRNALIEVNNTVLDLLGKYPQLAQYISKNDFGQLEISQQGMDYMTDQANQAIINNQAATLRANTNVRNQEIEMKAEQIASDNMLPMWLSDKLYNDPTSLASDKEVEKLIRDNYDEYTMGEPITDEYVREVLAQFKQIEGMDELIAAIQANTSAQEVGNEAIAANILASNDRVQNSDYANEVISTSAGVYDQLEDEALKKLKDDDWGTDGISKATKVNDEAKKVFAEYAEAAGISGATLKDTTGTDSNRKFIYEDSSGQEVTVSLDAMRKVKAAADAQAELGKSAEDLIKTFADLDKSGKAYDQALMDMLANKNFDDSTNAEFKALQAEIDKGLDVNGDGTADYTGTEAYLDKRFGDGKDGNISDETAQKYGYESAEAMVQAFEEKLSSSAEAWENIKIPDSLSKNLADNITLGTAEAVQSTIDSINLGPSGVQAGEDFVQGLNTMLDGVDTEDQQAALKALMDIDWSSWDALEQADVVLQDLGGDIDLTSEEWKQFAEEMRVAAGATPDYTTLKTDLNEVSAILNDLDFGEAIDEEDYQKLVAYNNEWERFFMLQADGSRQFIGNSKDMQEEMRNSIREQRKELQERKAAQEGFDKANWGHEDSESGEWVSTDWKNKSGSDTDSAKNLLNATGATQDMLETLGYTDKVIQDMITKAESGQEDLVAEGTAQLREMYQRIGEFQDENLTDMDTQFDEMLASTAQDLSDLLALKDEISEEAFNKQLSAIAGTTESMAELQELLANGLDATSYQENLQRLAEGYDNCSAELKNYQEALLSGDEDQQIAAQHTLESAVKLGEACKKYGLVAEDVETQARLIAEAQGLDADSANRLAIANQRLNKGVKSLHDNWKDWSKVLKQSDHTTMDYATTLNDAMEALADLTGTLDVANIPLEFLDNTTESGQKHLDLLGRAAKGDVNAINQLGVALGEAAIKAMEFNESLVQSAIDGGMLDEAFDLTTFNNYRNEVLEGITALQEAVQNGTLTAGQNITDLMNGTGQSWVESLNQMAIATGMSVDEMNSLLNQLGVQAKVDVVEVPQKMSVPTYTEYSQTEQSDPGTKDPETGMYITPPTWAKKTWTVPGKSIEVDGFAQVAQISTEDGKVGPPQIKFTGTAGSSKGFGGVSPSSTKSSGGGNKQSKEAKKIDKKTNEEVEEDRYHVITEQLERLNDELEKISKAKDRAFGPKKLALMDAEIAKQEELIAKNKEYATALKNNRNAEMEQLKALGAVFDGKGVITNYNKLIKANQADYSKYNEKVDYYNGLSAEKQEALDKAYQSQTDTDGNYYSGYQDFIEKTLGKTAEKRQEEFEKLLKNYESDQEEYEKIMQEIQDAKNAIFDEKLEKIDYVVQIKLDVDERDIKYLEFLLEELEDKDFHAAEAIANIGMQTGKTLDQIDKYKKGIEDILSLSGYDGGLEGFLNEDISLEELQKGGLTEEGLAKLEEYVDGLADANEQLREMRENAWAQVNDEFEEYLEKMDRGLEKIEHLKSITQSYQNIVDIVGKKFLGVSNDLIDKMNKSVVSQSQDLLKANKAKMEALQASYDQLKNEDTSNWSDQALKERQQLLDKMEDELQSAKEAFMSSWEEALQASADRYAQAVDNIIEEFSDRIAGLYGSLDELQEAYDRASDIDSQYLEDYEQIYQLSKLTRDINNSIDDTDNIAAKEEYRDLLEEINQIEEDGTKLSEYDLEVLQKKFELRQAQIALEEAQNAKSSVGMVRGEDGNYSYVYTANDDDVANAEQNYEDKLHEMQVLNGEYINNLQEQIIQAQAECAEALAAIKESDFNSYEEWREAVDRTQAYYDQKMDFYYSQLDGALTNNRELYENDWQKYHDLTGYKISDDENYVDKFEETNYSILTGYQTLEEAHGAWTAATGEMLLELSSAYSEWKTEVENAMALAGTSVDEFADKMEEDTERNVQDSTEAAESVVDMGQQMEDTFSDTLSAIADWESEWGSAIDNAIAKNKELIESFNEMKREMAGTMDAVNSYNPGGDSNSDSSKPGGKSSSDDSGSRGANNSDKVEGVAAAIWMDGGTKSGWYVGNDRKSRLKEKGITEAQAYINAHGPNGDIYATWNKKRDQLKKFYYGSFDTGGYTGDWGDKSGRLALLHSKEIVLNAKDTENFLQAIDMVREISSRIDLNAKYTAGMMDMMQPSIGRGGTPEIVQNIEINADFPDATDHSEIELAFNNLINTASRYANRVR